MTEPAKIWYFLFPNPSLAWTAKKSHKLWYQKGQISFFLFWAQTLIRTYGEKMPTSGNLNDGFRHFPKRFRKLICLVSILTCELPALQHWYYADPWLIQDDVLGRGSSLHVCDLIHHFDPLLMTRSSAVSSFLSLKWVSRYWITLKLIP